LHHFILYNLIKKVKQHITTEHLILINMNSTEIRKRFISFFENKNHSIFSSAPIVVKNDPTLMFTNAGMNQFKDYFLGNQEAVYKRIANSQKCLRVSGKHNDLEEVGHDTYHHTMFEMLGNWSFGDYFKKEAIAWGWEFLTDTCKIDKNRLYVTVFGGDASENLAFDQEAYDFWKAILPEDRVINGSKKDNFWEMGDSGPCGPCSEIHIDLRDDADRTLIDGRNLVNTDNPLVIEIWNLVFIEFNRKADGKLEKLKDKHVDTGMGFERLCMVMQGVKSNYDTDVFTPLIARIAEMSGFKYGIDNKKDIAMRVIADHVRAVAFCIADGQLPSNVKAGYVIRRILRRAVRYAYVFLDVRDAFIYKLVDTLALQMGAFFPEINAQKDFVKTIIAQEENSFLKTLSLGLNKFEHYVQEHKKTTETLISGTFAFELYDTYGFPLDLTVLMAKEINWQVDMAAFDICMEQQKERSKKAATVEMSDWFELETLKETEFVGYDTIACDVKIMKFRRVTAKNTETYHLVFDKTPFYAESGGQVGDKGQLSNDSETIEIEDTIKENNLIIHKTSSLPLNLNKTFSAKVDIEKRTQTAANHSATHLMHAALREVLGKHVEQKGSLVNPEKIRFDFAHFARMTDKDIKKVEDLVNAKIRENIALDDMRHMPYKKAIDMGAIALFGEKYTENVRVIAFDKDFSIELCGGTHIKATGKIGLFKIVSESAIAAGIRRIEAVTGQYAFNYLYGYIAYKKQLSELLKNPTDIIKTVETLIDENFILRKELDNFKKEAINNIKDEVLKNIESINGIQFIAKSLALDLQSIKDLAFALKSGHKNLIALFANTSAGKVNLSLLITEDLVKDKGLNASLMIKEIAKEIKGGGGGQPFFATAGGTDAGGVERAVNVCKGIIEKI